MTILTVFQDIKFGKHCLQNFYKYKRRETDLPHHLNFWQELK